MGLFANQSTEVTKGKSRFRIGLRERERERLRDFSVNVTALIPDSHGIFRKRSDAVALYLIRYHTPRAI